MNELTKDMSEMSKEELIEKLCFLEEENKKLKEKKIGPTIIGSMKNQRELDFIYPYYDTLSTYNKNPGWRRSVANSFSKLRDTALIAVDKVNNNNTFVRQKVKDLSREDILIAIECADEIAAIVAKYKKQYLLKENRKDIVDAFGL